MGISSKLFISILFLILNAGTAFPCAIPVFRYALENWKPDSYELFIFSKQPLSGLNRIVSSYPHANVTLRIVNPDSLFSGKEKYIREQTKKIPLPSMALKYPDLEGGGKVIWTAGYSPANIEKVFDSPGRRKIFSFIEQEISSVWVLVESGNSEKDDRAAALIEKQLPLSAEKSKALRLEMASSDSTAAFIDMPVSFRIVRISRSDEKESVFVRMLLASEYDLDDYKDEPIAFPVYGRGRVLYALVGDGINSENVDLACVSTIGPCSCLIKSEHPGIDLLFSSDWESVIGERLSDGITVLAGIPNIPAASTPAISKPEKPSADKPDSISPEISVSADLPEETMKSPETTAGIMNSILLTFFVMGTIIAVIGGVLIFMKRERR
jgi:hypothetical protein